MSFKSNHAKYFLGHDSAEVPRMNQQYTFLNSVFDYPQLVPAGIDTTQVSRVIDIGAGTGAWALDFLSLPGVCNRDVQVYVCDITTNNYPRGSEPEVRKIKFLQQDVTKPFPNEFLGTFDLINFSVMSFVLTEQGWKTALQNLYALLKPGGRLIIRESDLITYNHGNPPPAEGQEPNVNASLQGTSNVAAINRIVTAEAMKKGFVVGLSYYLSGILREASFVVLSSQRASAPFGNYCDSYKGKNGTSLSEYKAFTISNYVQALNSITRAATAGGVLQLADGTRIESEEGRLALMEEVTRSVTEGGFMTVSDWVAMRPL